MYQGFLISWVIIKNPFNCFEPLRKGEIKGFQRSVLHTQASVVFVCTDSVGLHLKNITKILKKKFLCLLLFFLCQLELKYSTQVLLYLEVIIKGVLHYAEY